MYDVVVAGGSIAGLCCAREAALGGCSVLVIEDDAEVGTPDHCGGMVSVSALQRLQVTPRIKMSSHKVHTAKIFSPSGYSVSFDAKAQNVISIDRRELDKEIARQAQKAGAVVRIKTKYVERTQDGIRTGSEEIACKEFVDARGIGPLAKSNPSGIIPCCQCEVHADWIESRTVEVHMDAVKYPGFFAWTLWLDILILGVTWTAAMQKRLPCHHSDPEFQLQHRLLSLVLSIRQGQPLLHNTGQLYCLLLQPHHTCLYIHTRNI